MSHTYPLFLRPVTALYFGRPGSLPAGEAHAGISWFPPPISAFQGMIRTKILEEAGIFSPPSEVERLVGRPDALPDGWQLTGPFPSCRSGSRELQIWLPMPCFLLPPLDRHAKQPVFARPLEESRSDGYPELMDSGMLLESSADKRHGTLKRLLLAGAPETAKLKPDECWISARNMYWALSGGANDDLPGSAGWQAKECSRPLPPFVRMETKTGLARQKKRNGLELVITGTAEEGMLYFLSTLRFTPDAGLYGNLAARFSPDINPRALEQGAILGGKKGGVLAFEQAPGRDEWWECLTAGEHLAHCPVPDNALVWIALLSPGQWETPSQLPALLKPPGNLTVEIVSILAPPPLFLGGFSLAEKRQRQAKPWYPPGSSILVRLSGGSETERRVCFMEWNNRCLLTSEAPQRSFGYGHILVSSPLKYGGPHA
ncbi:MAG: type III-B CRISPR module-associated Cmr3 family protein [Thermodesulfobacteriota bacterium]